MGAGYVVCFPDWATLEAMPPHVFKQYFMSKQHGDDAHYLAMVNRNGEVSTHRGPDPGSSQVRQPARHAPHAPQVLGGGRSYAELTQELQELAAAQGEEEGGAWFIRQSTRAGLPISL